MRAALISLTEKGRRLSERMASTGLYTADRYCFYRHSDGKAESFESVSALTERIFTQYDALIYICACGIAVRAVSMHIKSKLTDPAVIVADDCGRFVIPILSGHIGGANALAERIAAEISAQAVITTATDSGGRFSPDSFAAANGLIITDMAAAKEIAAAVANGETAGIVSDYECIGSAEGVSMSGGCRTGIYIGTDSGKKPFEVTLQLIPRNVVVGIGCRRGTSAEAIERAVAAAGIDMRRICAAASIDIKADEQGLKDFCAAHGIGLSTYSAEQLMDVKGEFTRSEFVLEKTGCDNVCERSAVLCSGGRLIVRKTALDGVTAAAAEKPIITDIERKQL